MANNVIRLLLVNYMPNNKERTYIKRNREEGHARLFKDYFYENPIYPPQMFRRRFQMRKPLFLRIVEGVGAYDTHFQHKPDATGRLSLSPLIKCTAALRLLEYGEAADRVDEYKRLEESTTRKVLVRFLEAVIHQFGDEYLRRPTVQDLQRLLQIGAYRRFPGMDLWIWHSFFGVTGSCNDINVLQRSPVFDDVLNGRAPRVTYIVNGHQFDTGYYLADGIYPQWSTFIPSIPLPQTPKDKLFAEKQEAARKDVKHAFEVLQIIQSMRICSHKFKKQSTERDISLKLIDI
ncbi:uncharacterized protein LOC141601466 [Silene latifolia]|uniref:uncharacterized protein LOC141601466 n=1 Tax=Silene latifolia TaxID=37657 RepID=UPI003D77F70A